MAQEVRIINWCDPCLAADEHTEGQAFALEFSIGGSRAVRVEADLCERHGKDVTALTEWLTTVGRRSKGTAQPGQGQVQEPEAGPVFRCPEEGCDRDLAKRVGVIQHLTRTHGLPLEQAQAKADQAHLVA